MVAEQEGVEGLASQDEDFDAQDCLDNMPRHWRLVRGLLRESGIKGSSDCRLIPYGLGSWTTRWRIGLTKYPVTRGEDLRSRGVPFKLKVIE